MFLGRCQIISKVILGVKKVLLGVRKAIRRFY